MKVRLSIKKTKWASALTIKILKWQIASVLKMIINNKKCFYHCLEICHRLELSMVQLLEMLFWYYDTSTSTKIKLYTQWFFLSCSMGANVGLWRGKKRMLTLLNIDVREESWKSPQIVKKKNKEMDRKISQHRFSPKVQMTTLESPQKAKK